VANHELKDIADAVILTLTSLVAPSYTGISITKGQWKTEWLPAITTYGIRIAPTGIPWTERTIGPRYFQRIYRFDLFLLCKVTDEDLSLWGEASDPTKGVFQLVQDVKDTLRGNRLGLSFMDQTYEEVGGDVAFDLLAAPGFESAGKTFVHRCRMPYTPRTKPFCWPLIP